MKTKKNIARITLLCCMLFGQVLFAQKTFSLDAKSTLAVSGTSTLHDWEMTSETAAGKMVASEGQGSLSKITSLTVEMQSESLKSGKKAMDKNTYKALKTEQYKTIKFELKDADKVDASTWNLTGSFTIAGVTKQITVKAKEAASAGNITLEGSYAFKLTDFKITPPTAMMGTIKTGDAVKISFKLKFK
mgnify:CR=1 FL=1